MNGRTNSPGTTPDELQVPLDAVTNLTSVAGNGQVSLTWSDPKDKYATPEGEIAQDPQQLVSVYSHTVVVRKVGSHPAGPHDGIVIVESQIRNQYESDPYVDETVTNDTMYCYGVFAINQSDIPSKGQFTFSTPNVGTPLSDLAEGSIVTIHENGAPVQFLLSKHNYESDLNGQGRDLFVRTASIGNYIFSVPESTLWGPIVYYPNSELIHTLESDYRSRFSPMVRSLLDRTKYTYNAWDHIKHDDTTSTATCNVLIPSLEELRGEWSDQSGTPAIGQYFSSHQISGEIWTRSSKVSDDGPSDRVYSYYLQDGRSYSQYPDDTKKLSVLPMITLPSDMTVDSELTLQEEHSIITDLSTVSENDSVFLYEDGMLQRFYIAKINYESGLNGTGRTLLARTDIYLDRNTALAWNSSGVNAYANGDIDTWLNTTYKAKLDPVVQQAIGETTFYYTPGNGNTTVTTLSRGIFLPSVTEIGLSDAAANVEGSALPIASLLQYAHSIEFMSNYKHTRTPSTANTTITLSNYMDGDYLMTCPVNDTTNYFNAISMIPVFTLPSNFKIKYTYLEEQGIVSELLQ